MKNYFINTAQTLKANWLFILIAFFVLCVVFAIDSVLGGAATGTGLAMAGGGSQYRNAQVADGAGWDRKFTIAAAYAALLQNVMENVADDKSMIFANYNSTTVFSTNKANYNGFPVGTQIMDIQAKTLYLHQTATTWVANAFA